MVALGVRLRADGQDVVIGASPGFADWVRGHGLGFHAVGGDIEAWIRSHGEIARHPARLIRPAVHYLRREIDLSFEQTCAAARGANLLVSGIHAAAPSVAEALAVPYRTLLFCPQMLRSRHHPPPGVPWRSPPRFCNQLLWSLFSRGFDTMLKGAINRHRRAWGLPPIANVLEHLVTEHAIVASDPLLGELPPDVSPSIAQIGSLSLAEGGAFDPALERFIKGGEPPLYIGFGSMPDNDPQRSTRTIVEALAACNRRGVILSGWAGLGEASLPASVFVARSASHALLLPRVALAIHHGGAGTTVAAARAGIPQIVVPLSVDQYYWGNQIYLRGLGSRPIARRALTAAKLSRAIEYVTSRPQIAERAREIQAGLARTDGVSALTEILYRDASEDRVVCDDRVPSDHPAHRAAA